jgi:FKBP-type peptidyl-prolyl cis-trans isomerase
MIKTARLAVVLWLALPLAVSLAGCGSSDDAGDGAAADGDLENDAPATPAGVQSAPADAEVSASDNLADDPLAAPADVQSAPADAEVTDSGLASRLLAAGTGTRHPVSTDRVSVHYSGWTTDGRLFDSSYSRGAPAEFPLDGVIRGWTEGLQLMVEGERRRFWIPQDLAYGANPAQGRPRGMLVFDVELLDIVDP